MARTPGADARLMTRLRDADPAPPAPIRGLDERAEADLAAILATQTVVALPPRRRPVALVAAAAVAVLAAGAGLTAVAQRSGDGVRGGPPVAAADAPGVPASDPPSDSSSRAAAVAPAPDAQAMLGLGAGVAFDYDLAESPAELAEPATVVMTGTVVEAERVAGTVVCEGTGGDPVVLGPEAVLRLDALQVVKGQVVEVPVAVVVPLGGLEALQSLLPVGTRVLVYAAPGIAPDCSDVLRVTSPQGLAVQAASGQVVWPMLGQVREGDLSQALPGGSLIAVEQ